jgi:UDP-hydrolysing UDP-N-acetyl-D-glucosamine 2-epimerase
MILIFNGAEADWPIVGPVSQAMPEARVFQPLSPVNDSKVEIGRAAARVAEQLAMTLHGYSAIVIAGDRTEALAAALAATCLQVPVIHLHGGETSLGAIDEQIRHAISMLANTHFVAHQAFKDKLEGFGIPPDTIIVSGAPSIDQILRQEYAGPDEIHRELGISGPFALLAYHPATKGEDPGYGIAEACKQIPSGCRVVACLPNADYGSGQIKAFMEHVGSWIVRPRYNRRLWLGLMAHCQVMIGNSSAMHLEAPTLGVPCIHIGSRQGGRMRVSYTPRPAPRFPIETELGDGHAADRIADIIRTRYVQA